MVNEETTRTSDRIEKRIVLRAPRARVWRALTSPEEFGQWFGCRLDAAAFVPGGHVKGNITFKGYEDWTFELVVERVDPQDYFSWRWHPYPKPGLEIGGEPMTRVELRLSEVAGGTELTVVESGFDRVHPARRAEAFRMNDGGWAQQLENVRRHVES